ncbi:universal stress protein [Streptacidiphilus fuscans]|uniref:Universal stress protein n=1 Tax=Streptacidiphilus fuscans TaxID=2789292 RepID=A0A931B3I5_9ACTN|nr:universal stress protein [Streptacidiphilus fuscans]MBF9070555.1 universal stress protein [Streptacidiphilus fuscans]
MANEDSPGSTGNAESERNAADAGAAGVPQSAAHSAHAFELGTDGPSVLVVGIDGSDSSMRAAAYAAGLARRQGAKLALVYVQPISAMGGADVGAAVMQAEQEVADALLADIRQAAERMPEGQQLRWEFYTSPGDPYQGLVDLADQLKADGVVIGASQKAGHRLVGSVGVRLVKSGRWPVTVVP